MYRRIALVSRDLGWPANALDAARATLEAHGDRVNAAHARNLEVRRLLLIGRLDEAQRTLAELEPAPFPSASRVTHELVVAGIAVRHLRAKTARAALARAERAARHAGILALTAEVESASLVLTTPAARLIANGDERFLLLDEVEALQASKALVVDACRYVVRDAAFDGQHRFQVAEDLIRKIDPKTGRVLATIPAPGGGGDSGLAWAEGTRWVGQYRDRKIHQIDPQTGATLRTIESNRFVTGVTWIDGELWHATWEGDESDLRRVDPRTGEVLERLDMPPGVGVSPSVGVIRGFPQEVFRYQLTCGLESDVQSCTNR